MHGGQELVIESVEAGLALEGVFQTTTADAVAQRERTIAILREKRIAKDDVQRSAKVLKVAELVENVLD
jgi:hypothetical protein